MYGNNINEALTLSLGTSVACTLLLMQCIPCWKESLHDVIECKSLNVIFSTSKSHLNLKRNLSMFIGNQLWTAKNKE